MGDRRKLRCPLLWGAGGVGRSEVHCGVGGLLFWRVSRLTWCSGWWQSRQGLGWPGGMGLGKVGMVSGRDVL
eukprot:13436111-Alexandrium_andersonii.AAC.1